MDWTSFDVVAKLRGVLGTRKLGHSGTLDPMATGVLPVFCGGASKAVDLQLDHDKAYRAVLRLGQRTDTGDITGTVLETAPVTAGERELRAVLPQFVGKQMQVPPMYSAVKVGGQPLYKLAREGKTVERKARPIEIYSITYGGSPAENEYVLEVTCSKGTYIRTLLEDIADALGQKGTMSAPAAHLRRAVHRGRRPHAGRDPCGERAGACGPGSADAAGGKRVHPAAAAGGGALGGTAPVQRLPHQPLPCGGWPLPGAQCRRAVPGAGQHHRGRAPGGKTVRGTELTRKRKPIPMQIISQFVPLPLADPAQGTAVAMGYFDGIHIGHRAVIDGAVQWARAHGAAPAVFTFRLPVDNKMKGKRLLSSADKHALIASLGVEYYLTPDFEGDQGPQPRTVRAQHRGKLPCKSPVLRRELHLRAKAAGTPELLRAFRALRWAWKWWWCPWHSSRKAGVLHPHPHRAGGRRHPGGQCHAGHALRHPLCGAARRGPGPHAGVPTINQLYPQGFQMPRSGIYITRTLVNGTWYPSATGLGSRPTVNDDATKVTCETFIPGFPGTCTAPTRWWSSTPT